MFKSYKHKEEIPGPEKKDERQETKEELYKRLAKMPVEKEEKPKMTPEQKKEMQESVKKMYQELLKEAEGQGNKEKIKIYKAALQSLEKSKE